MPSGPKLRVTAERLGQSQAYLNAVLFYGTKLYQQAMCAQRYCERLDLITKIKSANLYITVTSNLHIIDFII